MSGARPIRVVLVDDHPVVLDGIEMRLSLEEGLEVAETCTDGREAFQAIDRHMPDVVVIDHHMPHCTGVEVIRRLREAGNDTPVVLLSASLEDDDLLEALHLGRVAVVLKEAPSADLVTSIRAANEEQFAFADSLLERVLRLARTGPAEGAWPELTPREVEVVHLVASGSSNKRIARDLGIVEGTVKMHVHSIFGKLDISNRVQLAALAHARDPRRSPAEDRTTPNES